MPIIYTYGVRWHEVDLPWAQRWDSYLASSSNVDVHWFSVANSMLIVLFLSVCDPRPNHAAPPRMTPDPRPLLGLQPWLHCRATPGLFFG